MQRKILRENGREWCELEIRLQDGRLSICGSSGYILTRAQAKREASESWASYYDEVSDDERRELNRRLGCRSPNGFARRIAEADGELHGLDVHKEYRSRVFVTSSCGQIREDLQRWFPEAQPLFPWHLNDMRPGCEHQEQAERDGREQYTTGEACEVCGYRYGSEWRKRELPTDIVCLAETICQDEVTA